MVDATGVTVNNEAKLVAASARISCPLASSYLAVSVQDLMAADKRYNRWSGTRRGHLVFGTDQPSPISSRFLRAPFVRNP